MKKIKEIIKKYDVAIMFIIIAIMIYGDVFYHSLLSGDEYILLNHTFKMYNRQDDL